MRLSRFIAVLNENSTLPPGFRRDGHDFIYDCPSGQVELWADFDRRVARIDSFTSNFPGGGRATLRALRVYFDDIGVQDPGTEDDSLGFWEKMHEEGLVQELIEESVNESEVSIGESWNGTGNVTILYNIRSKVFVWDEGTTHTMLALERGLVAKSVHFDPEDLEDAEVIGELERSGWIRVGFIEDEERCYCSGQTMAGVRTALRAILPHLNMHIATYELADASHAFLNLDSKQIKRFLNGTLNEARTQTITAYGRSETVLVDPSPQQIEARIRRFGDQRGIATSDHLFVWSADSIEHASAKDALGIDGFWNNLIFSNDPHAEPDWDYRIVQIGGLYVYVDDADIVNGQVRAWFEGLNESLVYLDHSDIGDFLVNPMGPELVGYLKRLGTGSIGRVAEARAYQSGAGDIYVWPAYSATHFRGRSDLIDAGLIPADDYKNPNAAFLFISLSPQVQAEHDWEQYLNQVGPVYIAGTPNGSRSTSLRGFSEQFGRLVASLRRMTPKKN